MPYFLFLLYFTACCLLIASLPYFRKTGIGTGRLLLLFALKVGAGLLITYTYSVTDPNADVFVYFNFGIEESDLLLEQPREYVRNFFAPGYKHGYGGLFATQQSYWNNLSANIVIKLHSILNFFSLRNLYVNVLLFNFIVFFAPVSLFRIFDHEKRIPQPVLLFTLFLLPSAVLFPSLFHKDGLLMLGVSICIYQVYFWQNSGFRLHRPVLIVLSLLLIFSLRSFVFFLLLPALLCWLICNGSRKHPAFVFGIVYGLGLIGLLMASYLFDHHPLDLVVERRQALEAISLQASSRLPVTPLQPTMESFIRYLPQALMTPLVRPTPFEYNTLLYIPFKIEVILFISVAVLAFWNLRSKLSALDAFLLFFSLSALLLIGYTVPVLGAVLRYKCVFALLFFLFFLQRIRWKNLWGV